VPLPSLVKVLVAKSMQTTGEELFLMDSRKIADGNRSRGTDALLFHMATDRQFLDPLRSFRRRRLFANLNADFVVPLGTAAFLSKSIVTLYRQKYASSYGIVHVINSGAVSPQSNESPSNYNRDDLIAAMRAGLDSMQWEKVLVHFDSVVPIAHNKIAAVTKFTDWMDSILGELL
jgi:hypothetical protein